jgi:hypothetical protein
MSKFNQIDKIKTNFRKRNYKAFLFFIIFTLFIWSFVQMSKTYEHDVEITFSLKEIPQDIVIENNTQTLFAQVKQTGFKILSINLFNSNIVLNFTELDSSQNYYSYDIQKNEAKIAKSLKLSSDEFEINEDSLKFNHYKLSTKKLKIKPNFQISFGKGYDSIQSFQFEPSFIEVSGKDSILKSLEFISTQEKVLKDVSDTISGTVEIQKIDSVSINYLVESITYSLPVTKFTEGSFEIPISLEEADFDGELVIFPKTVNVNFKTSLSNYERIDESGFKVIAKYNPSEDFMLLELVKQPKLVKNVSLENYKVDYLIKK